MLYKDIENAMLMSEETLKEKVETLKSLLTLAREELEAEEELGGLEKEFEVTAAFLLIDTVIVEAENKKYAQIDAQKYWEDDGDLFEVVKVEEVRRVKQGDSYEYEVIGGDTDE